jgi:hypothetical protein
MFPSNYNKSIAFTIEDMRNRRDMGIIGDESNSDLVCAPFLFQSFLQVTPPLLNESILA